MSDPSERAHLISLVRGTQILGDDAARPAELVVTYTRSEPPAEWLVDGETEQPISTHREAHAAGRPSEAAVHYGSGVAPEAVVDRLLALAALASETGMLRAVCPVPAEGDDTRPGSWGVEDLGVVRAARSALADGVWVRPHWRLLGSAACQVAVAFGANDWSIPADDRCDPEYLAAAVGAQAVAR